MRRSYVLISCRITWTLNHSSEIKSIKKLDRGRDPVFFLSLHVLQIFSSNDSIPREWKFLILFRLIDNAFERRRWIDTVGWGSYCAISDAFDAFCMFMSTNSIKSQRVAVLVQGGIGNRRWRIESTEMWGHDRDRTVLRMRTRMREGRLAPAQLPRVAVQFPSFHPKQTNCEQ